MDDKQEFQLIERCKSGDRKAMESLVKGYQRPIYNAAYRILGNADDAADVTQAVFLKAIERIDQYKPEFRFFSWIYRIAVNESINYRNRAREELEFDEEEFAATGKPEDPIDAQSLSAAVQSALMRLQEDYRVVVVLRHFSELSYREISEVLKIPEKTVKSRLYSARQLMKDSLAELGVT